MRDDQAIVDAIAAAARSSLPPGDETRFERQLAKLTGRRPKTDAEREARVNLLERHCPAVLPEITIARPAKGLTPRARLPKRRRHSWKAKQLLLPL